MSMEALSVSLLLFAITRYSLSTTLLRSRLLSLVVSNRGRAISAEQLTAVERLLLTLTDLGLSYSLLRRLLPSPPPLAFSIFSLSTPLPTLFFPFLLRSPRRDALLQLPLPSLRTSILFSALWTLLHELLQVSVVATYRQTEDRIFQEARYAQTRILRADRDKVSGIEIRGKPLETIDSTTECSICLSSTFNPDATAPSFPSCTPSPDTLEIFCTSCSTPLHPGCLMQWWLEKSAQQPSPSIELRVPRVFTTLNEYMGSPAQLANVGQVGAADEAMRRWRLDIVRHNLNPATPVSPIVRDLVVNILRHHGFADSFVVGSDGNYSLEVEIDGTRIRGFGRRSDGLMGESLASNGMQADNGCWELGSFSKIIVDSPPHLPKLFPPTTTSSSSPPPSSSTDIGNKGVVIYVSPRYVELRSVEKSLWWWKFPNDGVELGRVRSALVDAERERSPGLEVGEAAKDPLIAVVVSNSVGSNPASPASGLTGPNCPLCRSSLTLYVHLLSPPPLPITPPTTLTKSLSTIATLCDPIINSSIALSLRKAICGNSWYQLWSGSSYFGWRRLIRRWMIQVILSSAIAGSWAYRKGKAKA